MKRMAVLTSGGDAPGMNAAIRAVVRSARDKGLETFGVRHGFNGLVRGVTVPLGSRDVSGIIQQGGTFLGTARCPEFATREGRDQALECLSRQRIDALIIIGGNGSQQGAHALSVDGFPVVGIASTIDNDLCGADISLGVDTALNIALEAIDRLKVTASSHRRGLVVEVMGRDCGYLALITGITGGAEAVVIPERETTPAAVAGIFREAYEKGKKHALAVVAEGSRCDARALIEYFRKEATLNWEIRATILGHVQRGGAPTAFDRLLGTRLGAAAVDALVEGHTGSLVGLLGGQIARSPLAEVAGRRKDLDLALLDLAGVLSA
jgi:6-phosphofructokinase 1